MPSTTTPERPWILPAVTELTREAIDTALESGRLAVTSAEATLEAVVRVARAHGRTWDEIALCLGVTRQAASQRYGR